MMRILLSLLAAAQLCAVAVGDWPGCVPSVQLGAVAGGGQELLISARQDGTCHCPRIQFGYKCSSCLGYLLLPDRRSTERQGDTRSLRSTVFLTGGYRARCCPEGGACHRRWGDGVFVDGINYSTWNVSTSSEQVGGSRAQLSVQVVTQWDSSNKLGFYFPELLVLIRQGKSGILDGYVTYPEHSRVVTNHTGGLRPGDYEVLVRPPGVFCPGGCTRWRSVSARITATVEPPAVRAATVDESRGTTLYVAAGVLAGAAVAGLLVYLSYRFLYVSGGRRRPGGLQLAEKQPPPPPAPAVAVTALLLHRGGRARAPLAAALRAGGVQLLDVQDGAVLNLLLSHACPADALALEPLRDARLVFVTGGGADGGGGSAAAAGVHDSFLHFVRNGRLGQDLTRVFVVCADDMGAAVAAAAGGADEPVGLLQGRVYRAPADVPLLLEHLRAPQPLAVRLPPPESQPAAVEGPVVTDAALTASVV